MPESVFTIENWIKEYFGWLKDIKEFSDWAEKTYGNKTVIASGSREILDLSNISLNKMPKRMLAKTLKADTHLLSLILNKSKLDIEDIKALAEG